MVSADGGAAAFSSAKPDALFRPVTFDLHSDLGKPLLDILQQLPQLSLVGTEDREVVHLPQIV